MDLDNAFNINKKTWNDRVAIHAQSDFYKLDAFKKGAQATAIKFDIHKIVPFYEAIYEEALQNCISI